jgi:hypothetical protein
MDNKTIFTAIMVFITIALGFLIIYLSEAGVVRTSGERLQTTPAIGLVEADLVVRNETSTIEIGKGFGSVSNYYLT